MRPSSETAQVAIAADVTGRDALAAAADRVQRELGGADVLVNNAGVMLPGPFGTQQREEARRMAEVNLLGAMTATEAIAFAVTRPRRMTLNEILLRPTDRPPSLAKPVRQT